MARHSKNAGRTVYTVVPKPVAHRGAHRMEDDDRVPLAHRVSAVLVAAGVAAGTAAIAHVASAKSTPLAASTDLGALPDLAAESNTVHAVDPGAEVGRLLQFQQMYAMENFNAASKVAQDGYTARQEAAKQAAAEQAAREAEMRKPAKQREIEGWIKEAIAILQANGTKIDNNSVTAIYTIIIKESNGNPNAVNNWDSNAAKGTPSKGLMQCIDPTFNAYKLSGHNNIFNPVDNIIAGVRYTYARYGSFANHPGLKSLAQGSGYRGY